MSRPHSGSTILDMMLSNSGQVAGCGEIMTGFEHDSRTWKCTCGEPLCACPVWGRVQERLRDEHKVEWAAIAEASVDQAHKRNLLATWRARPETASPTSRFGRLAEMTRAFAATVREVTGRRAVLDSSKLPSRALFILKFMKEARAIHMVRDPRNVLASHYWRSKINDTYLVQRRPWRGPLMPLAWVEACLMWTLGNLAFELISRVAPDRCIRVRYEDLRDRPAAELRRLAATLGLDLGDVIERVERGETFGAGHMVGGNPVSREGAVRFEAGRERTRERVPQSLNVLAVAICWPMMILYGYALSPSAVGRVVRPAVRGAG